MSKYTEHNGVPKCLLSSDHRRSNFGLKKSPHLLLPFPRIYAPVKFPYSAFENIAGHLCYSMGQAKDKFSHLLVPSLPSSPTGQAGCLGSFKWWVMVIASDELSMSRILSIDSFLFLRRFFFFPPKPSNVPAHLSDFGLQGDGGLTNCLISDSIMGALTNAACLIQELKQCWLSQHWYESDINNGVLCFYEMSLKGNTSHDVAR